MLIVLGRFCAPIVIGRENCYNRLKETENEAFLMKRTFTTIMPDRIGALLEANRCITSLGLNITRVSYNKSVDVHMLFIEVEGQPEQLELAQQQLEQLGYLGKTAPAGSVILLECLLQDRPGTLQPVLELIRQYGFNISYISSQGNGTMYQQFKMGLFVEDSRKISAFLREAALLCDVRVLDYNHSEKLLDNTVFYLNFAEDICRKAALSEENKSGLIVNANRIMQMLDEKNEAPYKTFDYIGKFAEGIHAYKGERFNPRLTRYAFGNKPCLLIEPQSGSNVFVMDLGSKLLFVDCCFSCYEQELLQVLRRELPDFDRKEKVLLLTHADVDHIGNGSWFSHIYASENACENLRREVRGEPTWREEHPLHRPYVRISKYLSHYRAPDPEKLVSLGQGDIHSDSLSYMGTFTLEDLCFDIYEGNGGHVKGELVAVERNLRLVFTGDILVNIKGFTPEQAAFNRLAPYLMTSVDTTPDRARKERGALMELLAGEKWYVFPGHGAMMEF